MPFTLDEQQVDAILAHLQVERHEPELAFLDALIDAYGRRVPWESASRIVRRDELGDPEACPRWPEHFWAEAQARGTGGTCFESNLAFFTLLQALGFHGYLTINNMLETIGCHTAIIIRLHGQPYLVDAGYPILCAMPLDPRQPTQRRTRYLDYRVSPTDNGQYLVENWPHPKPYMFHLIDVPVDESTYVGATTADYGPGGLFLDHVIIRRNVDGDVWRFDGNSVPPVLERFHDGERYVTDVSERTAEQVGNHFGIDAELLAAAFSSVKRRKAG